MMLKQGCNNMLDKKLIEILSSELGRASEEELSI